MQAMRSSVVSQRAELSFEPVAPPRSHRSSDRIAGMRLR
jgi:hypothetical protein